MIVVKKGKEPNSLVEFRLQNPDADYEDIPSNDSITPGYAQNCLDADWEDEDD